MKDVKPNDTEPRQCMRCTQPKNTGSVFTREGTLSKVTRTHFVWISGVHVYTQHKAQDRTGNVILPGP
jgi:hypothetical protein